MIDPRLACWGDRWLRRIHRRWPCPSRAV